MPQLRNTCVILTAFFFCFGVIAVSLWQGKMHQRCYTPLGLRDTTLPLDWLCGGYHGCPSTSTCAVSGVPGCYTSAGALLPVLSGWVCTGNQSCPTTSTCLNSVPTPMLGHLNYDDLVGTTEVLFMTVMLADWVPALEWLQDVDVRNGPNTAA